MPPSTRPAARIPAALRKPAAPPPPTEIHLTISLPDERFEKVLRDRIQVYGPIHTPFRATVHLVVEDPNHPAAGVDPQLRHALLELEMVNPDQVGFAAPVQVTLGWPPFSEEP